jgi:transcriptional regulator with XRE-family HTH domain
VIAPSPASAAKTAEPITAVSPRTEGQRLLLGVSGSHTDIATQIGGTKQSVSEWRRGEKTPGSRARELLHRTFGIDPAAWTQRPGAVAPPEPAKELPKLDGELEHLEELLRDLRALRSDRSLTPSERARVAAEENKTLARIAEHRERQKLTEARYVHEHPGWHRLRAVLFEALKKHPEAYRDVLAALQAAGA